jgi:hypothetical protein
MLRRLLPLLLVTASPAHAAWLHLCPPGPGADGPLQASVRSPGGAPARLVASETAQLPGCTSIALGVDLRQVDAIRPLSPGAAVGHTILLQGSASAGRFAVSEVTLPPARPPPEPPAPMPFNANLLDQMQARPFGVEERIHASLAQGRLQIDCDAGNKPAGVLLTGPWYLPQARLALQLAFAGNGAFHWQVADAALASRENALALGGIQASGMPGSARLALPGGFDPATWKHFSIACPPGAASLSLESLALAPLSASAPPRATWVWHPDDWRHPAALLAWARIKRVGELFIVVPLDGDKVRDPAALAAFVRQARHAGVAVWSIDGDPRMVLPGERAATVRRASAYVAYNAAVEPAARLAGMQFDVEPYLLPDDDMDANESDRRYLELAAALRQAAGGLRLEFVVPFWWGRNKDLLRGLAAHADSLAVMDYRTAPDEIERFAVPFLDWAARHGKRVRIALEAGRVAPETQRRYLRADAGAAGELLLVDAAGVKVMVVLRHAQAAAPGADIFKLAATRELDGSATSFYRRRGELMRLLPRLERDFGAWPGFAGIALHELR